MNADDVNRYTSLFQNALIYTVSIQVLDHIINTASLSALPIVILTVFGTVSLVIQIMSFIEKQKAPLINAKNNQMRTLYYNSLNLIETLLRLGTDVLVQFSGQAVSRLVLYSFSNTTGDTATCFGVIIGVTMLHALTQAAMR